MPHPRPHQQEFRPGVKYICDDRLYGDIHSHIVENGHRPIVVQIDGSDITLMVQRKEVFNEVLGLEGVDRREVGHG